MSEQLSPSHTDVVDPYSESTSLFLFVAKRTPVLFWHSAFRMGTLLQFISFAGCLSSGRLFRGKKALCVVFANSCGVNMPTTASLRPPTGGHQMEGCAVSSRKLV